jgi:hypothetical protein
MIVGLAANPQKRPFYNNSELHVCPCLISGGFLFNERGTSEYLENEAKASENFEYGEGNECTSHMRDLLIS